jgi:hypothetical protein
MFHRLSPVLQFSIAIVMALPLLGADETRWTLEANGGILWKVQAGQAAHQDQIEMSGRKVSLIATYGVDADRHLILRRQVVFPLLRTIPNDTHASLSYMFGEDATPRILVDGRVAGNEVVESFAHKGIITIRSVLGRKQDVLLTHTLFPSTTKQMVIERLTFTNASTAAMRIEVERTEKVIHTNPLHAKAPRSVWFSAAEKPTRKM